MDQRIETFVMTIGGIVRRLASRQGRKRKKAEVLPTSKNILKKQTITEYQYELTLTTFTCQPYNIQCSVKWPKSPIWGVQKYMMPIKFLLQIFFVTSPRLLGWLTMCRKNHNHTSSGFGDIQGRNFQYSNFVSSSIRRRSKRFLVQLILRER